MKHELYPLITDVAATSGRYTMASERLVHLSLFSETEADGEIEEKKNAENDRENVKIELFNKPAVDTHELTTTQNTENPPPADRLSKSNAPSPETQDKDDDKFDDNIELF